MEFCLSTNSQHPNQTHNNIVHHPDGIAAFHAQLPSEQDDMPTWQDHGFSMNRRIFIQTICGSGGRKRDYKKKYIADPRDLQALTVDKGIRFQIGKLKKFSYKVLEDATRRFSTKNLVGQGGFADVYKGYLSHYTMKAAKPNEGFPIAVKRIRRLGSRGHEEWLNEVIYLSKISHPNAVNLIGYCREGQHRMLVIEYLNEGSLEDHPSEEGRGKLNWNRRINIALGAARGLDYIHSYEHHIAASIIMMHKGVHFHIIDCVRMILQNFNAKLSDFGLARDGPEDDQSHEHQAEES
ncbi:probable serine/threonine-protein kinase PBL11 [Neltuma alba]|uniref:probable serine/threonine-protein kinase PBL11 n=1 Tax=Neltuma alba TaxID=207710 RepID=UPI0010A43B18|nr:probable serine/threonine-protein kinase PBL11 [Prosopis alba]